MEPRLRLAAMGVASLVLLAALSVVLLVNPHADTAAKGFAGALRPDIPRQTWTLTDQTGKPVTLGAKGPAVVTFLYTHCQDTCPTTASQVRGALDDLGRDVPTYAVSVDPTHDTPGSADAFLAKQHLTGRMQFLLRPDATLQRVWRAFGIAPQTDGRDHSAYVVLLDRNGRQRVGFPADQLTPETLAHDLRRLLNGAG